MWQELAFSSGLAPGPQGWAPMWVPGSSSLKVPTSWESWSWFARAGLCPGPGAVGTPSPTHPPWWILDSTLPARKDKLNSRAGKVGGSAIASENEARRESPPSPCEWPFTSGPQFLICRVKVWAQLVSSWDHLWSDTTWSGGRLAALLLQSSPHPRGHSFGDQC